MWDKFSRPRCFCALFLFAGILLGIGLVIYGKRQNKQTLISERFDCRTTFAEGKGLKEISFNPFLFT